MRIGILTLPLENNYGGNLQAYALQKVLCDLGHDALTINWHNNRKYASFRHHILGYCNRLMQRLIYHRNISICWNPFITAGDFKVISKNIQPFINKHIRLTKHIWFEELEDMDKEYQFDAYVVGSDQVWVHNYSFAAFLDFVKRDDVIKIAYAASSNENSWLKHQQLYNKCIELSKSFKGISVRESFLRNEAEVILGKKVELVLDPTFLLTPHDYLSLLDFSKIEQQSYVFSYILDDTPLKNEIINRIVVEKKIRIKSGMPQKKYVRKQKMNLSEYVFPSMEDWLQGIFNSDFVVTDSFHGMVFAIIFNKQFVVIGNEERGIQRFYSLLDMFDLRNRLVSSIEDITEILSKTIEYDLINLKIESLRNYSLNFLRVNL